MSRRQSKEASLKHVLLWVTYRSRQLKHELEHWIDNRKVQIKDWKDFLAQLVRAYMKGETLGLNIRPPGSKLLDRLF